MTLDPIGICGTGELAAAIATRIGSSGTRVIVHGFAPVASGRKIRIERAANLFDLASECGAVIAVYETHAQLREALAGALDRPGLLGAMAPGTLLVDLSGGLPEESRKLAGQLAGGTIGLVEAAQIGGSEAIQTGSARIFVGGFGEHIDQLAPSLACLGSLKRIGPQGSARSFVALSESVRAAYQMALEEAQLIAAAGGFVPEELANPPLSGEERAQFARHVEQALTLAENADTPFLKALAQRLGQHRAVKQP